MSDELQGMVRAVVTTRAGGVGLSWTGNTLVVDDARDFPRDGGRFTVEGHEAQFTYTEVVDGETEGDPDTLTTVEAAPGGLSDEFRLDLWPGAVMSVAEVALPESLEDTVPATIPHSLKPYLPDGVRDPEAQESVLIAQRDMAWYVVDILGQPEVLIPDIVTAVDDAKAEAMEAHGMASEATTTAQDAHNAAVEAKDAAADASTAAGTAKAAADAAAQDAANAAGIAGGKADVLIQSDAPAADYQAATTLWIDTTGGANTPKRWDGGKWVTVTDKAATDAAAAAASAQTTASEAASAAATAQTAADNAQAAAEAAQQTASGAQDTATSALTSANGRNSRVTSTDPPSGSTSPNTGLAWVEGDTWWQWDSTTARNVIGAWTWRNGDWEAEKIGDAVLASLDVNKLVVTGSTYMKQAVVEKIIGDAAYFKAITSDKIVVTSAEGLYPDSGFDDAALSAQRAANSGWTYDANAKTMTGSSTLWLTKSGQSSDWASVPFRVGGTYVVRVWATNWTSSIRVSRWDSTGHGFVPSSDITTLPDGAEIVVTIRGSQGRISLYSGFPAGGLVISRIEIRSQIGGVFIEPGGINTPHLATGALNYVDAFGMKLTSAEIISPDIKTATSGSRVELTTAGLKAYNSSGDVTVNIWGNGGILEGTTITGGTVRTAASGARIQMTGGLFQVVNSSGREIIKIAPEWQPPGSIPKQPALVFAENVAGSPARMAIYGGDIWFMNGGYQLGSLRKSPGTDMYLENNDGSTNTRIVNVGTAGNIYIDAGRGGIYNSSNWHDFNVIGASNGYRTWAIRPIANGGVTRAVLQFTGGGANMPQTTITANMFIDSNGSIWRTSSARRFKNDIQDIGADPYRVLDVPVRDWVDATASMDDKGYTARTPGVVAEEVEEAGLSMFVTYNEDGQTSGVLYDRLPLLLIPVVRDLKNKIEELERAVRS